ncbi:hypothetical protein [Cellulomonas sp. PhB150]|uniref:hypothetical protein n=1 Tax=Cellulomonas sp. PhB150 TaxID=2485188 RepID=UPI000FABCB34|nr:hypothetical protein [Cellulomonas sp. PhB150]ROS30994.1 hypothetical protein EDF34_0645 [Cellulomonas sp. PhB150]
MTAPDPVVAPTPVDRPRPAPRPAVSPFRSSAGLLAFGFAGVFFGPVVSGISSVAVLDAAFDVAGALAVIAGGVMLAVGIYRLADHVDAWAFARRR